LNARLQAVTEFARRALEAERLTAAGRVNVLGMFGLFLIIAGGALLDLAQVIGRIFDSDYETGGPSLVALLAEFGGLVLLCTVIVGLLDSRR
jgi:hypothetical protein